MILKNAQILGEDFVFSHGSLAFTEKIEEGSCNGPAIDCEGGYVIPGLIDVHTHGALGFDADAPEVDFDAWQIFLLKNGVTTFLPSTTTQVHEDILASVARLNKAVGINMEGPYLSIPKRGAHVPEKIREVDVSFLKQVADRVRITTIAPEVGENASKIRQVCDLGIKVSLGHSTASYEVAAKAFAAGATQLTHTFNGCPPLDHREPGLVGAALDADSVFCEVISDGIHLHPAIVRMLYRQLGTDRMVMISDSIRATGLANGKYCSAGLEIYVKDGQARLEDGRLAGSTVTLYEAVRRSVGFGIPLAHAVKMASLTPAHALGFSDFIGSLAPGKDADVVVLNGDLSIRHVFYKGEQIL
ncbi:MAG: N-acetylglucosamine-6-phosphate deacetylase [Ruminococcaceae bacterium]|nr:N-acetylglucosamine-6-phosphate deacetylase [Oscillospiraceae bacterium]